MFDYRNKIQKLRNENGKGLLYRNYALFLRVVKTWKKPETKYFVVLLYYFILLSKASMKQMTKAASALGLGKSIFFRAIFRMYTPLHT